MPGIPGRAVRHAALAGRRRTLNQRGTHGQRVGAWASDPSDRPDRRSMLARPEGTRAHSRVASPACLMPRKIESFTASTSMSTAT